MRWMVWNSAAGRWFIHVDLVIECYVYGFNHPWWRKISSMRSMDSMEVSYIMGDTVIPKDFMALSLSGNFSRKMMIWGFGYIGNIHPK